MSAVDAKFMIVSQYAIRLDQSALWLGHGHSTRDQPILFVKGALRFLKHQLLLLVVDGLAVIWRIYSPVEQGNMYHHLGDHGCVFKRGTT